MRAGATGRVAGGVRQLAGCGVLLFALGGCELAGLGRIQPQHVEGTWTFRSSGAAPGCGIDSVHVRLRDGNRTWGAFFIDGEGQPAGTAGPPLTIGHGRVTPRSGRFNLVFSDHASPPARTRQFALEGTFDESGGAVADYIRDLPEPQCSLPMVGRRVRSTAR